MHSGNAMSTFFDDHLSSFIELMQRYFTFKLLGKSPDAPSIFSRIDRIYVSLHPTAMEDVTTTVTVRGAIERRSAPSDHRAVSAVMSKRVPGRRCLQVHHIANERYPSAVTDAFAQETQDKDSTMEARLHCARRPRRAGPHSSCAFRRSQPFATPGFRSRIAHLSIATGGSRSCSASIGERISPDQGCNRERIA